MGTAAFKGMTVGQQSAFLLKMMVQRKDGYHHASTVTLPANTSGCCSGRSHEPTPVRWWEIDTSIGAQYAAVQGHTSTINGLPFGHNPDHF